MVVCKLNESNRVFWGPFHIRWTPFEVETERSSEQRCKHGFSLFLGAYVGDPGCGIVIPKVIGLGGRRKRGPYVDGWW